MACIYHIYSSNDTSKVYVGQTSLDPAPREPLKDDSDPTNDGAGGSKQKYFARPMDHFSGLYSNAARKRENEMFFNYLMENPLNSFFVEIYDESNYFGLDPKQLQQFLTIWTPSHTGADEKPRYTIEQLNSKEIKITAEERKVAMQYYTDAAEIIHNYIMTQRHNTKCLTYQIGSQALSWVREDGVVLNNTMTVEQGINILNSPMNIAKIQEDFNKRVEKDITNNQQFLDEITDIIVNAYVDWQIKNEFVVKVKDLSNMFTPKVKQDIVNLFAKYLRPILEYMPKIYQQAHINMSTTFDNLYSQYVSKFLVSFKREKGSFNILDALVQVLTTKSFQDDIRKTYGRNAKSADLKEPFKKAIGDKITIILPKISIGSFFNFDKFEEIDTNKEWYINSPTNVYSALDNSAYGKSFRYRAYWFFLNVAKKMLPKAEASAVPRYIFVEREGGYEWDNGNAGKETFSGVTTDSSPRYYIVSAKKLSNLIKQYYDSEVNHPYIKANWFTYLHTMLTIFTNHMGTTLGSDVSFTKEIIHSENGEIIILPTNFVSAAEMPTKLAGSNEEPEESEIPGIWSYQFSPAVADNMLYWLNLEIQNLTIF